MISKKTKYGLQALFNLAQRSDNQSVLIAHLAKEEKIPQKFLEAILLELKNHGLLQSKKGKGGGYSLALPADEITLGQVIRILEGPIAKNSETRTKYRNGDKHTSEEVCSLIIKEVQDAISNVLDKTSLTEALNRAQQLSGKFIQNYVI